MKTKIAILALATLSLAACNKNEEPGVPSNFPADGVIRVATSVNSLNTRAGMTTENLSMFNIKIDNDANAKYSYYGFYYKLDEWKCYTDGTRQTELTMLWQNSTEPITVTALIQQGLYVPKQGFINDVNYGVSRDQSKEGYLQSSDILYMEATEIDPATDLVDGKLPITFKHLMSKVNLSITLGTELNVTPGTGTNPIETPKVNGTICRFDWNASTNNAFNFANYSAESIAPFAESYTPGSGTTRAVAKYEVILVPQTVAADGFSVSFTINGKDYEWKSKDAVTLVSGKQYNLNLTAGKDVVTMEGFGSSEWTGGTGGNVETE